MAKTNKFRFSFIIVLLIGIWLLLPHHIRMALTYWFPGIEDYKIFDNRTVIAADDAFIWPLASDYNQTELSSEYRDTLESYQTIAYLVIQNDSIIYEEYWDDFGPESYTNSFSAAKSIVSLLIGAAIDDGYIQSVDQKVGDFLPYMNDGKNAELKIRNLLTMSSGSNWDESYTSPLSMTTKAYYGNNLTDLAKDMYIVDDPGKIYSYKSGDSQLLSQVLIHATGKSLSEYTSEKLWKPMGASQNALWSLDKKNGTEKAYCCFNSNARDFALLGALINHQGYWRNQQIISENYINDATTSANYLKTEDNKPVDFYGFQYWILNYDGMKIPYARGILGQYIFSIPEKNAIIVRLGHKRSKVKVNYHPSEIYSYLEMGINLLK
ncbi:serine hydrolase domain-containing protein [Carboxylicivirga linearis]|uniref:Serine hydrolase n=1 Tax=Carboxylicivirga linearis TaxID=1628157 RepID=A0ABS5JZG8_9BACT|nr:serine hydrolase [Carboxylicivirga linearis]MBS2100307.1 serine hydrolase [Carboxylicivirga linearis]